MSEFTTKSKKETQELAHELAQELKGGEVLCLYGELGAGKTTFIQGLAKGLGIKQNITSPTFVLMKRYRVRSGDLIPTKRRGALHAPKKLTFYHLDCYRLNSPQEAIDLGIEEIWDNPKNIIAIEWADKISNILPKERIDICLETTSENERKITFFAEGEENKKILLKLKK